MCTPAAVATLAVSAATTLVEYSAARADYKAQVRANEATTQSITDDRNFQLETLAAQQRELAQEASERKTEAAREAAILRARQLVSSSERGGLGNSAAALQRDVDFQAGLQTSRIDQQYDRDLAQNQRERRATIARADNQAASIPAVRKPSALAAGLQIAGAGLSSYRSTLPKS